MTRPTPRPPAPVRADADPHRRYPLDANQPRRYPLEANRPRRYLVDATAGVALAVVLSYLLPARLIVPHLTILGRPAVLAGFGLLIWWLLSRLHPVLVVPGRQPMRWALLGYFGTVAASYVAGQARGLTEMEAAGAHRTVLMALAAAGVLLAAADGIRTRHGIDVVLRLFCWGCGAMALIALSQFALRVDLTNYLQLPPLLTFQRDLIGFDARGGDGLVRVAGTAGHYIEFSVLMVIGTLVAIHYGRFCPLRRDRQIYTALAMLQAAVIPIALARTGILALAAAIGLLVLVWPLRTTFNVLAVGVILAAMIQVARPGLLATLRALLLAGDRDPSVQGRLDDYGYVAPLIAQRPWFGRGVGTFLPELYQLLDNQWLATLVSTGIVGVTGLALLLLTGVALAARVRARGTHPGDRDLAAVLAVTIGVAAVAALTFDALYYSTYLLTLHLLLGLAGALWRVTATGRTNHDEAK